MLLIFEPFWLYPFFVCLKFLKLIFSSLLFLFQSFPHPLFFELQAHVLFAPLFFSVPLLCLLVFVPNFDAGHLRLERLHLRLVG